MNKSAQKKGKPVGSVAGPKVTPSEAGRVLGRLSYPARVEKFGEAVVLNTACKNLEKAREKRWAD